MIALELFLTFFRIGLFTFGGGYGMIPLVQQEALNHGWMDAAALYRFIGVCESTPGPIAVNMATFIGAELVIMLLSAAVLRGFRQNRFVRAAMAGIRPVVAGMIAATGLWAALRCLLPGLPSGVPAVDFRQALLAGLVCLGAYIWHRALKRPFSPILLILYSAACGLAVYGIRPA